VSGPKVEREVLAKILLDSVRRIPERYSVVLSCGNPSGSLRPRSIHGMRVYDWIENQDDFIEASDLVISRAGHGTIMKSIAHGRPMILIPIPDHTEQYGNARRATSLHVAEMIDQNRVNEQTLEMAIRQILGNGMYRMKAVEIGERATSMYAVSLVCNLISSTASHN
jgi:UDP:flavonoid glycosyltransferase YjiC (YdhE family)